MGSTAGQLTFLNHTVLHQEVCISLLFAFPLCLRHRHTHPHTHACARAPSPVLSIPVLFVLFVGVCLSQPLCTLQGISAKSLLSELSAHMETHTQITRAVTLTRVCSECVFSFRCTDKPSNVTCGSNVHVVHAASACRSHDPESSRHYCNFKAAVAI